MGFEKMTVVKKCLNIGLIMVCFFQMCSAQIFPKLEGEALINALREDYRPSVFLNYSNARDTMYAVIDLQGDSVECIYSGYKLFLMKGVDPSKWLSMENHRDGINTEHVYPRSKGPRKGTDGFSNLYILRPSRIAVNSARSNHAFGEVDDQQTNTWYYKADDINFIPEFNIDRYSEKGAGLFEPRENVKGDIARAMFYYYTLYREDALREDSLFFINQQPTLCQWNLHDPIDESEQRRNILIAPYQENIQNPFIADSTLATRLYCPDREED